MDFSQVDLQNWAIIDSGAMRNFLLVTEAPVVDIVPTPNPLIVTIPNVPGCNPRTIAY